MYSYFEDSNFVYLVLELCHNGELQRFMKNSQHGLQEADGIYFYLIHLRALNTKQSVCKKF